METNIKDVYSAGDCAETINLVTCRPTMSQLGTTAVKQAKVAGTNAAGGYATFSGALGSWITRLFDTEIDFGLKLRMQCFSLFRHVEILMHLVADDNHERVVG